MKEQLMQQAGHGFLIAAPQSGSGKTTVSLAIMAALVRRGFSVAPFKCGPDFIDPGYHRLATGRPSINLDAWMCGEEFVRNGFHSALSGSDIAVIEGVMGLFDGIGASSLEGSSAQVAAMTGAPVVLVVNARGMAASVAPLVNGFAGFDPQVKLAGVIFNNVGSDSHAALLRQSLAEHCPGLACFGCIPRNESLALPSRHLGLVTAEDNPLSDDFFGILSETAERCLELDMLAGLRIVPPLLPAGGSLYPPPAADGDDGSIEPVRIAVARDSAFCFMYEDNLRLLREAGAEPLFFSPLRDACLPAGIHGIYLPGGYPELFAAQLDDNGGMKRSLYAAVSADMPVYAECGGFVYLTEGLNAGGNQVSADFAGVFPVRCTMLPHRKALGYRQVKLAADTIIGREGAVARGHEFHYSEAAAVPGYVGRCYHVSRQGAVLEPEGFRIRNCLASYIHLHFGSNREIAPALAAACRRFRNQ